MKRVSLSACFAAAVFLLMAGSRVVHASASPSVLGLYPKGVGEFAYADLKALRSFRFFAELKRQLLPQRFRLFEDFLLSAGIRPDSDLDELTWAALPPGPERGEQVLGVAVGRFSPDSVNRYFEGQKLASVSYRGTTFYAFGSGTGPGDIFFAFIDSNTAAFGQRESLENLMDVRFGEQESLLRNDALMGLINEANGKGPIWAVMAGGYVRLAFSQLMPEAERFGDFDKLVGSVRAITIDARLEKGLDANFALVCPTTDEANTLSALLQAGFIYQRWQSSQTNPELAQALESVQVMPSGTKVQIRMSVSEETLQVLILKNVFATKL
jgi:hypothetical protein